MNRGFSLIEAVVVIAIMAILTGIFLFDYRSYDARYTTEAVANEIATALRQVQVWGTSTRTGADIEADDGYGIFFEDKNNKNTYYIIFADSKGNSPNGKYEGGDTLISTVELPSRFEITGIRIGDGPLDTDNIDSRDKATIVVRRDKGLGFLIGKDNAGDEENYAEIHVARGDGEVWQVAVWKTGKVEVSRAQP